MVPNVIGIANVIGIGNVRRVPTYFDIYKIHFMAKEKKKLSESVSHSLRTFLESRKESEVFP